MATTVTRKTADFSDLDFNFTRLSSTSDVAKKTDVEAVKQSMKALIQTNYFDRPFHPELGSGIRDLLFENFTPLTRVFLQRKIEEVITNFEPRVSLESIKIDEDQDGNRLVTDIYFYVQGVTDPVVVTAFLQRLR